MLSEARREPDGLLHAASHLTGSLRHAQLEVVGAPKHTAEVGDLLAVHLGDMWHKWCHATLRDIGWPLMQEVKLHDYMPSGWGGTADLVLYHPEYKAFVLGDYKTMRGEGFHYINQGGAKLEHIWQVSAYFHALVRMGLPMVKGMFVMYWPKNDVRGEHVEPVVHEVTPISEEEVHSVMVERRAAVDRYLEVVESYRWQIPDQLGLYLNEELVAVQDRVQKVRWSKRINAFELLLVPHWSAAYCPFPNELCDCSTQGVTKIGEYDLEGQYTGRKGYQDILPVVTPTNQDYARRRKEQKSTLS